MTDTPELLGPQVNFTSSWNSGAGQVTILNCEIASYRKFIYPPAVITLETGPLGQVSQRQLNTGTPPYQFEFVFILDEDKKNDLEGLIFAQQLRYYNNNERSNVELFLNDERMATLEILNRARQLSRGLIENRFDTNPTSNSIWQFSQFIVKCIDFNFSRFNSETWTVNANFIESRFNLSDLTI